MFHEFAIVQFWVFAGDLVLEERAVLSAVKSVRRLRPCENCSVS